MRRKIPNLLIVAGDGRNSGKTTMCCRIIKETGLQGLVAVKISQHIHKPTEGLRLITGREGFSIYQETDTLSRKDSSEMLRCGAGKVIYIQSEENCAGLAFEEAISALPEGIPVICESPSLIKYAEPGVLIIMVSENKPGRKDISVMQKERHLEFSLEKLEQVSELPVWWDGSRWNYR